MRFSFLLLVFLVSINLFAQKGQQAGYIITLKNDTIHGIINQKSNSANAHNCSFQKTGDDKFITYTPEEIKAYMIIDKKYYVSKEIKHDDKEKTVFLEFLIDGIVDLFFYKTIEEHYYYIEKDKELIEISNEEKEKINEYGDKYYYRTQQYIGALTYAFEDSPETLKRISKTRFSYKSLIKTTKHYHETVCKDGVCIDYSQKTKMKFYLEPYIGYSVSKMEFDSDNKNSATSSSPVFGADLRIGYPSINYLWNVIIGIRYSRNNFEETYKLSSNTFTGPYIVKNSHSQIQVPVLIEYSFPIDKIKPFINMGFQGLFLTNPEYSIHRPEYLASREIKSDFQTFHIGILGGIGTKIEFNNNTNLRIKCEAGRHRPLKLMNAFMDREIQKHLLFSLHYGFSLN